MSTITPSRYNQPNEEYQKAQEKQLQELFQEDEISVADLTNLYELESGTYGKTTVLLDSATGTKYVQKSFNDLSQLNQEKQVIRQVELKAGE